MLISPSRKRPAGRQVQLLATCLCDSFFDDVARATVEVLEHLGCRVLFAEAQTCCGQPAFNGGDWDASRRVVRHMVSVFAGDDPVVVPSGSCAAMVFHGAPLEFEGESDVNEVKSLASRTWELADFIVHGLGVTKWEGKFPYRIAFHRSCHCRGTESVAASLQLLTSIADLEIVEFDEIEQCCGFGGTFAVSFPNISAAMGSLKVKQVMASQPDYLVSGDMGCLMHLGGIIEKQGLSVPQLHFAQVLRSAITNR